MKRSERECGFCRNGKHEQCPNMVFGGINAKSYSVCSCGCSVDRCIECKRTDRELTDLGTCTDAADCLDYREKKHAASPLGVLIRECQQQARETRATQRGADPAKVRAPRKPAQPKPTSGACLCCGQTTKGGRFLPGHDARYISNLIQKAKDGNPVDPDDLRSKISPSLMAKYTTKMAAIGQPVK